MKELLYRALRGTLSATKKMLVANKYGRNLLYDINNQNEFSNMYSHEFMLADRIRVDTYHEGIQRHVREGDLVVDLGTGTGILSLFASRKKPRKIYALDHSDFINVAREVARHNSIDCIEFVPCNSRNFTTDEKVDVIIHEQMGDELLDENMIENLLDLKQRVLKPGGLILPGRFELFVEPVQLRDNRSVPFVWEHKLHGFDFSFLEDSEVARPYIPYGSQSCMLDPGAEDYLLVEPEPVLRFDLNTLEDASELPRQVQMEKAVLRDGKLDGFVMYFKASFDDECAFDTSPLNEPITCWRSRLFRVPARQVKTGDLLSYQFRMADLLDTRSWTVQIQAHESRKCSELLKPAGKRLEAAS